MNRALRWFPYVFAALWLGMIVGGYIVTGRYAIAQPSCVDFAGVVQSTGSTKCPEGQLYAAASNGFGQRTLAVTALFVGGYIILNPAWNPTPPPDVGLMGTFAFLLTFGTAGSMLLISQRFRDVLHVIWPRAQAVIIGDGASAAAMVRSAALQRIRVILIVESRTSPAALEALNVVPTIVARHVGGVAAYGRRVAIDGRAARRAVRLVRNTIVATDSDGDNLRLHWALNPPWTRVVLLQCRGG